MPSIGRSWTRDGGFARGSLVKKEMVAVADYNGDKRNAIPNTYIRRTAPLA